MAQELLKPTEESFELKLSRVCLMLEGILNQAFKGFMQHNNIILDKACSDMENLKKDINEISNDLDKSYFHEADSNAHIIVAVPAHLERILSNTYTMIQATRKKIDESVLFTDKAVKGLDYIYSSSSELLRDISDAIKTKNKTLLRHIISQSEELTKKVDDLATEHEERLIKGLCSMKSSPIFLDILDSLKGIIWHTSQIAQRV